MLLARLPASMSILWSDSRSDRMLDGVASGWPQFPGLGAYHRLTGNLTVRCWFELRCLHNVPGVIRLLLKHAAPVGSTSTSSSEGFRASIADCNASAISAVVLTRRPGTPEPAASDKPAQSQATFPNPHCSWQGATHQR
jgi:hypothetical protein